MADKLCLTYKPEEFEEVRLHGIVDYGTPLKIYYADPADGMPRDEAFTAVFTATQEGTCEVKMHGVSYGNLLDAVMDETEKLDFNYRAFENSLEAAMNVNETNLESISVFELDDLSEFPELFAVYSNDLAFAVSQLYLTYCDGLPEPL